MKLRPRNGDTNSPVHRGALALEACPADAGNSRLADSNVILTKANGLPARPGQKSCALSKKGTRWDTL